DPVRMMRDDDDRSVRRRRELARETIHVARREHLEGLSELLRERRERLLGALYIGRDEPRHPGIAEKDREPLRALDALRRERGVGRVRRLLCVTNEDDRRMSRRALAPRRRRRRGGRAVRRA